MEKMIEGIIYEWLRDLPPVGAVSQNHIGALATNLRNAILQAIQDI